MTRSVKRRGVALLEAVVALTILAIGGITTLEMVRAAARSVIAVQATEAETTDASAFLDLVALWPTADLDQHLGTRAIDHWQLAIDKTGSVYRVSVFDSTGIRLLQQTSLFRPTAVQ